MKQTKKTPRCLENPRKNPRPSEKPKSPRLDRKIQDLGRKPKEWQRCCKAKRFCRPVWRQW